MTKFTMIPKDKALPCPFCGNLELFLEEGGIDYHDDDHNESWIVICPCGVKSPHKFHSQEESIAFWNTRHELNSTATEKADACDMSNPFLEKLDLRYNPTRQTWECGVFATLKNLTITELKTSAVAMGVDPYQLRDRIEQDVASVYMGYGDLVENNFGHIDYENRL